MKRFCVLVACEESQVVCIEFRRLGYEAYSCDIVECSGGHPEWHIKGDCLPLINGSCEFFTCDGIMHFIDSWSLIIAHPPCTYLAKSGACRMYPQAGVISEYRLTKAIAARHFFLTLYNADCSFIAIENPTPLKCVQLPPASQVIEPYFFGDPFSKRTCLWLKNLPPLVATDVCDTFVPFLPSNTSNFSRGYRGSSGVVRGCILRSKTFIGIAAAMARQWSDYILFPERVSNYQFSLFNTSSWG